MTLRPAEWDQAALIEVPTVENLLDAALPKGGDRGDAHDRDQGDEQCVLDERGATFALDVGLDPGVDELVVRDH
jgi:hypothetical protein